MASNKIAFKTKKDLDLLYTKPKNSLRGYGSGGNVHIYHINQEYQTSHLHEHRHKRLAVKTIKEENSRGADREIGILKQFTHEPNIVTMLGYERHPFLIFLECCNDDLATYTKRRAFSFNQEDIFKISKDILFGMKPLSKRGIIHRDIKPHNILIDFQGSDGSKVLDTRMKLCDFGCSREVSVERMEQGRLSDITKNLGTVGFMAPEISSLLGEDDYIGKYTIQVDMWSFGATILWLASGGKKPFDTDYLRELHFEVNTNKRRDAEIHAKIKEFVKDEKICSLLVEVLKWNPEERNTVDQTIGLIKHLEKSDSTLEKKTGPSNIEKAVPSPPKKDLNEGREIEKWTPEEVDNLWLQPRDVSFLNLNKTGPVPPNALRSLSQKLLKSKLITKREYQHIKDRNYWDQLEIILREWVQRNPNEATMKNLTSALNEAGLQQLGQQLKERKILNSKKTKLSEKLLDNIKQYKLFIRKEKTIVTQMLPYGALEQTFQPETQRHKDIIKFHVNRKYRSLVDGRGGTIVIDIEELLAENNNVTMVRGPAGIGKTTFFTYCMIRWARDTLMKKFDMMIAFSCRDIKDGVIGSIQDIVFECSIIGETGTRIKKNFTIADIKVMAEEMRLITLVDGADEIPITGTKKQIKEIMSKVEKAIEDPSIMLNGQEIVIGFLSGIFLNGCKVLLTGRNSTVNDIHETFFHKIIPSEEIRIDENEVIVLHQEKLSTCSNFEMCELEDSDLRTLAHNILCSEDAIHVEENGDICYQVYNKLVNIKVMEPIRRIPCFSKWLIELINYSIVHDEIFDLNIKNLTSVMINLIFGRAREHFGMNCQDVESFCQLLESPKTRSLGEGLKSLTRIVFKEMIENKIDIEGVLVQEENIEYVKVGEELIEVDALKKMELMKMSRSILRKILLKAEHLTLLEILTSAHLSNLNVNQWPGIIKDMPKERLLMVLRFSAGLLTNASNDLIYDFMKLISDGSYNPEEEKIHDLYQVVLTRDEDEIPSTSLDDYEPIVFEHEQIKKAISAKHLSLLELLVNESGVKINEDIFCKNLPKKTDAVRDALEMSVKLPSVKTTNPGQLTVSMKGTTFLSSPSHYKSLLFLETMTTSKVKYNIEELQCQSHLHPDISPEAMAGVISGTEVFELCTYDADAASLLEVVSRCNPNNNKSMGRILLYNTNITAVPPNILAAVFTSYQHVWLYYVSVPDVWSILSSGHGEGEGLGRMEGLELVNVDLMTAPDVALAWVLASIKKVYLRGSTRLSDELWRILAERCGEGLGRMEELALENIDLTTAPDVALAWVLASINKVELTGTTRVREELWNVWANTMEGKYKIKEAVTEEVKVDDRVGAPEEALNRIKSCLKQNAVAEQNRVTDQNTVTEQNTATEQNAVTEQNTVTEQSTVTEQPSWFIKKKVTTMTKCFKR